MKTQFQRFGSQPENKFFSLKNIFITWPKFLSPDFKFLVLKRN